MLTSLVGSDIKLLISKSEDRRILINLRDWCGRFLENYTFTINKIDIIKTYINKMEIKMIKKKRNSRGRKGVYKFIRTYAR